MLEVTYADVAELAKNKGYERSFKIGGNYPGGQEKKEKGTYLELCLISRWLENDHQTYLSMNPGKGSSGGFSYSIYRWEEEGPGWEIIFKEDRFFPYKDGFLRGIYEALKLLL